MTVSNQTSPPLRLGILGCANVAKQFARDVTPSEHVNLVAVASRDAANAKAFAEAQGIGRHHGSYEALLADPDVEAIYLPLPNSLHAEWAIKAAAAGKHVLCEKPLAMGPDEARAMFDAARQNSVLLLEAYPYAHQPQTQAMVRLIEEGAIGQVRSMQAVFGFRLMNLKNIRMQPELGGGSLLDAGSYALSIIRLVMGAAPVRVAADATWADSGVDISTTATLYFADGRRAQLSCAMDVANVRRATISGSDGTIETEFLNHTSDQAAGNAVGYLPSELRVRRGIAANLPFEPQATATGSGFRFAAEAFARMVRERDTQAMERAAVVSIENAATLVALAESGRLGQPVDVRL